MRPRRRLSKGVRIYFNDTFERHSFNFERGIEAIKILLRAGWKVTASGSEEGAMVVHLV